MISLILASVLLPTGSPEPVSYVSGDVGVRATTNGKVEFLTVDGRGRQTVIATGGEGLGFTSVSETDGGLVLSGDTYTCTVRVPEKGRVVSVKVSGSAPPNSLTSAMFRVSLTPNGRQARPTDWYAPPSTNPEAVTSERFGTPVVVASAGKFGAAVMPDMADLATNRPMAPLLGVDTSGRTSTSAILTYGFASYARDADGRAKLVERTLANPAKFSWKFDVAVSDTNDIIDIAERRLWEAYGLARSTKRFPQTTPFLYYTRPALDMERGGGEENEGGAEEEIEGLWWETESGDEKLMAPKSSDNMMRLTADENAVRFAWALRYWGGKLKQYTWQNNGDAVINLLLRARDEDGRTTVAFNTKSARWQDAPFDASAAAQTARWKLRYVTDFPDYKEREAVIAQVSSAESAIVGAPLTGLSALFLSEFAASKVVTDDAVKTRARDAVKKSLPRLKKEAVSELQDKRTPSADTVATALLLARSGDNGAATEVLQRAFLSQTVTQPTNVVGTVTYGAFAGEHLATESQSAYTDDLLEACVLTGNERLAQRATAALRAPLGLYNHATLSISGVRLPDKILFYRSSPWFGEGASCEFGDWRGPADGIGQTLASIGEAMRKYGSLYTDKAGWSVGIDGVTLGPDGVVTSALSGNPFAFDGSFPYSWRNDVTGETKDASEPPDPFVIRSITLQSDGKKTEVLALPGFTVTDSRKLSGSFTFGDGTTADAQLLPTGFGAVVSRKALDAGGITFSGKYEDHRISAGPAYFSLGPPSADTAWPLGWRRIGELSDTAQASLTDSGETILSTADDGHGGSDMELTGRIESQVFVLDNNGLKFTMLGKADPNVSVQLIDARLSVPIATVKKTTDGSEPVIWELFSRVGALVYVRIVDDSKTGAVAIKSLRSADVLPGG
ncbi:MAG TPA: hypothetical protein VNI20_13810 [Fimbriimonadaceae bacterium]|nr:hypothetical protein [Fimbriimonadaceae bacterium]